MSMVAYAIADITKCPLPRFQKRYTMCSVMCRLTTMVVLMFTIMLYYVSTKYYNKTLTTTSVKVYEYFQLPDTNIEKVDELREYGDKLQNKKSFKANKQSFIKSGWAQTPQILHENIDGSKEHYNFLVMVSSHARHIKRRNQIRKHWGNQNRWMSHLRWRVIFVTGSVENEREMKSMYDESRRYHDIIIGRTPENFKNMSHKLMTGFHWLHRNFMYDYIVKCDDDVFIHINHVSNRLQNYQSNIYFGQAMIDQPVQRRGKYAISTDEFQPNTFYPYCSGGGYVVSRHMVQSIIPLFNWKKPLKIDDAYVGQLIHSIGITAQHSAGFYFYNFDCRYETDLLVSHPVVTESCMEKLMQDALLERSR